MVSHAQRNFTQKNSGTQSEPFPANEDDGLLHPDDVREIATHADGSSIYEIGEPDLPEEQQEEVFYDNLAQTLPDDVLDRLSAFLLECIQEDIDSRKEWMEGIEKVQEYLGFSIEDVKNVPFPRASGVFDTTLSTALIRFYATMRAEFFPQEGPVHIESRDDAPTQWQAQADRVKQWMNHYLTVEDKGYYADVDRSLLYLGFYGSMVKKIYYDEQKRLPVSRFIVPRDFIVDNDCLNIMESERLTHVLHLSRRDILFNQANGYYKDVELPYLKSGQVTAEDDSETKDKKEDVDVSSYTYRSLFDVYEIHTYLALEDFVTPDGDDSHTPRPYIVTLCKNSKKILRLTRNWAENDPSSQRINNFIQYSYLPGFGIYGLGLAHLLGTNALTLTKLLRQLVDAGSFKNLPGGLRTKGVKQQKTDLIVAPGQFVEVDTGGVPLEQAFMPLPYSEPSQALRELRQEIMTQTRELAATSEMNVASENPNAPVGTTLALLEVNQRVQSAVFRSFYFSLGQEFQSLYALFQQTMEGRNFSHQGEERHIQGEDLQEDFTLTPIADPSLDSKTHRIARAETLLKVAESSPDLYNMEAVHRRFCEAIGVQNVDKILKSETETVPPADPVTENMQAMKGNPLKVYPWQDDDAHMVVHAPFVEENPAMKAHIQDHRANKYLKQMQQVMGFEFPSLEHLQNNPALQNHIALMAAQATMASPPDTGATPKPVDPNAVMMADIQQKAMESQARERIANLKAETDVFRAQLDFEKEKAKIESQEEIAELKAETELEKEEMKNEHAQQRETGRLPGQA